MIDKLVPYAEPTAVTIFTYAITLASFNFLGAVGSLLAILYWSHKIKMDIKKYHDGSFKQWIKFYLKKNH